MTAIQRATRTVAATAAALLDTYRALDALSRQLTTVAFAGLLLPLLMPVRLVGLWGLSVSATAGLAAMYFGIRVAFDARLFRELATGGKNTAELDDALLQLGLLPSLKAGRPLTERFNGARRLILRQGSLLGIQAAGLLMAAWGTWVGSPH